MADKVTMNICVLWEDELRKAARLLQALAAIPEANEEERSQCIVDGYRACQTALYGLTDDRPIAMLAAGPVEKTAARARKARGG